MIGDTRGNAHRTEQSQTLLAGADHDDEEEGLLLAYKTDFESKEELPPSRDLPALAKLSSARSCRLQPEIHVPLDGEESMSARGVTLRHNLGQVGSSFQPEESELERDARLRSPSHVRSESSPRGIEASGLVIAMNSECEIQECDEIMRPRSGMYSAFVNMANSIIGAGIIGQPYAFNQAGLITGIVLLVGLTFTVDWTIRLILLNSKLSGANSFQGTMEHAFGKSGLVAISIAQWAFAFGGMIAFCIIVGDTIPQVMRSLFPSVASTKFLWVLTNRHAIIVILILGVSYPLSLYRDIAKLARASGLALVSMLVIILTIIIEGAGAPYELRGNLGGSLVIKDGVPRAVGVISFAFVCHHNSLLIYGSLNKPTMDRFARVTHYSTFVSMMACLAVALAGFLTFGDKTLGNILKNNFPNDNVMANLARLCFGLNMLSTLPLECFVCREVIFNYWFAHHPFNMTLHFFFTTVIVVTAMSVSLLICDLGAVFELVGATSACALAYILPPLCFIKLSKRGWKTIPATICIVFGVVVMLISLFQAVAKMVNHHDRSLTCE